MAKPADTTNPPGERKCSIEGCERGGKIIKGMCFMHYMRVRRYGEPVSKRCANGDLLRWLREHVGVEGDECIRWPYAHNGQGYAGPVHYEGARIGAQRCMCILARGEPPFERAEAAHSCGNGHNGCLNPQHLRWATPSENQADKRTHGTFIQGEKHVSAKLTDEQARVIKHDPRLQAVIALEYGVSPSLVSRIKSRQKWRHIN